MAKHIYGLGLIGEEKECNVFKVYHFDYRGSTVAMTDMYGNVTDTFEYDTYGKLVSRTGSSFVIFGYNGRDGVVTDKNGLLYMRARYYNPTLCRFVNADIISGEIYRSVTLNRYAYANGNPVSFVDPFGLSAERSATAETEDNWYTDELSDAIHFILDVAGFIPGWGSIADGLNALLYAIEGDWVNAGMSALAAIPGLGDIASGCKWATKFFKSSSKIYKALDSVATFITKIDDVIKNAGKVSDILYAASNSGDVADDVVKAISNGTDVGKIAANSVDSVKSYPMRYARQKGVKEAWKLEYADVMSGGTGISRKWSEAEIDELLSTGKVKGYNGHHIKNVANNPEFAADPTNIQFLTRKEHLAAHGGNWRNPTSDIYIGE